MKIENNFSVGELVTIIQKNKKPFLLKKFNYLGFSELVDEITGIVTHNKPMFKNGKYVDRRIVIGNIHLIHSKIIRK
jgi:hypothetical protein